MLLRFLINILNIPLTSCGQPTGQPKLGSQKRPNEKANFMKILENANEIYKEKEKRDGERIRKKIHMASDLHVIFLVRGLSETHPAFLGSPPLH